MNVRFLGIFLLLTPGFLVAQNATKPFKSCGKTYADARKVWESPAVIPAIRSYMEHCQIEITPPQRARLLGQLGKMLVKTRNYSEASPILRECRAISLEHELRGDLALCWEQSGESAVLQGACDAAETAFKATIDVPTTDNLSAAVHELAEEWRGLLTEARGHNGLLQVPAPLSPDQQAATIQCGYIEPVGEVQ